MQTAIPTAQASLTTIEMVISVLLLVRMANSNTRYFLNEAISRSRRTVNQLPGCSGDAALEAHFWFSFETTWLIANKRVRHTREGGYPGGAVKKKRGFLLPRE